MESNALRRLLLQIAFAMAAFIAWNAGAAIARSVAETRPALEDASYQQLIDAANAVVGVRVTALPNARSNDTLGAERAGSGVLIGNDGLVLTIGYLILEADQIEVTDANGASVPATIVAYDHATGFGLVKPIVRLTQKSIRIGTAMPISQLDRLMIVTGGADQTLSIATVVSRRQFAGYWEYMIDGAIFTAPDRKSVV